MTDTAGVPDVDCASATLWAVTSYFNPMGYRRRHANYRAFRRHLQAPLATIEWHPESQFELAPGDADLLVQVGGGSLMWQKERLLNLLFDRLPASCVYVAWVDCDIVFERADWAEQAERALQQQAMVQLFDSVRSVGRVDLAQVPHIEDWAEVPHEMLRPGLVAAIPKTEPLAHWAAQKTDASVRDGAPAAGFAWAARRSVLLDTPLIDTWVIGGGDAANCFAALGVPETLTQRHRLGPAQQRHYLPRARRLSNAVAGAVGHLRGTVHALWHGSVANRAYADRHAILAAHDFDPETFIRLSPEGVWEWTTKAGQLAPALRDYFVSRSEDG